MGRDGREDSGLARAMRLQIMLSGDELAALEDFRFQQRMPSRAAAIRHLLGAGISQVRANDWLPPKAKSADIGVLKIGED
jgi:hypothetical protein